MARGWESKEIESQMEAAEERRRTRSSAAPSPEELKRQQEVESLELIRTRLRNDLNAATHPRHREQVEAALRHIEGKIAEQQPKSQG